MDPLFLALCKSLLTLICYLIPMMMVKMGGTPKTRICCFYKHTMVIVKKGRNKTNYDTVSKLE